MSNTRPNGHIQVCFDVDRFGPPHTFLHTFNSLYNVLMFILLVFYSVCVHPAGDAYFASPSLRWVVPILNSYISLFSILNQMHC